jgi:hypothetical protein
MQPSHNRSFHTIANDYSTPVAPECTRKRFARDAQRKFKGEKGRSRTLWVLKVVSVLDVLKVWVVGPVCVLHHGEHTGSLR